MGQCMVLMAYSSISDDHANDGPGADHRLGCKHLFVVEYGANVVGSGHVGVAYVCMHAREGKGSRGVNRDDFSMRFGAEENGAV